MAATQPNGNPSLPQDEGVQTRVVQQPSLGTQNGSAALDPKPKDQKISYMSLPNKGQLALLCMARLVEPLANSSIQSYMFYQLRFFDPSASTATISTRAGILIGAKTAAQVCTGMLWGRLADSELGGRKVVLVIGLMSCCVSYLGYGLARNFPTAIFWQVFSGAMSSNVAMVRCVVAEQNKDKRYRTRALLLLPLFANAGMLLGPLIGGLLSSNTRDATHTKFPYLVPNIVVSAIYFIAALGLALGLKETLESLQHAEETVPQRYWRRMKKLLGREGRSRHAYAPLGQDEPATPAADDSSMTPINTTPVAQKKKRHLPFYRMWTFNVICTMLAHFIIGGHLGTFSILWSIFLSTPVGRPEDQHPPFNFNGGLGMLPRDVGFAMSVLGIIGLFLQTFFYPMLQDRFGTVRIWRAALFVFPFAYLLAPFPSLVASASNLNGQAVLTWLAMAGVLLLFVLGRTGVTPATTLLINDCTPHPSVRATIHTTATVVGNLSRTIFPPMALAIYGQGINIGVIGLGFWCVAALAVLACFVSRWVTEGTNGKEIVLEGDEEEAEPLPVTAAADGVGRSGPR